MILVTGGTGFVGQEVVRELLALGHNIRLLVRNPQNSNAALWAHHPRVELAQGDALKPETLPAAMAGVHAVIHLVGIIAETSRVTFEQAHFEATRNLLAAAQQAGVTRWIQMSAIGTRPTARSRYHLTKWRAEELVRHSGLDWTIFRPSLIYGYDHRDRFLNILRLALSPPFDFIQCYSFPLLNGGTGLIQPVSVREVARCFAHAPSKEASIGKTFDLVGPVALSWRDMTEKILAYLGKKAAAEEIPLLLVLRALLWLLVALLPTLIILAAVTGKLGLPEAAASTFFWTGLAITARRWRTTILFGIPSEPLVVLGDALNTIAPPQLQFSEQIKMAGEDNVGDPRPAAETFAYTPETFEQGLARCYSR